MQVSTPHAPWAESSQAPDSIQAFAHDVQAGLAQTPKTLPCRYFYDDEGSRLFEQICRTPEYYVTGAEREILETHAHDIVASLGVASAIDLCELGSGSGEKTALLIAALRPRQSDLRYVPIDISKSALVESAVRLQREFPDLDVRPVHAEYEAGLRHLERLRTRPKLILWLGSNIGNLHRPDAIKFLGRLRGVCGPRDRVLIGFDLRKKVQTLLNAYDDAAGVTAAFNKNLLARINRQLGGRFDLDAFEHRAVYAAGAGRVEMHLVSKRPQRVRIDALDRHFDFTAGESIHTECSYKYSQAEIDDAAARAGFRDIGTWNDSQSRFALSLFAPRA